jgi:hypothetical protein
MKKFVKTLVTAAAVVSLMGSLTACASPRPGIEVETSDSSPSQPLKAGSEGPTGYKVDYVDMGDGKVVECLVYGKNSGAAVISCDWDNLVQR